MSGLLLKDTYISSTARPGYFQLRTSASLGALTAILFSGSAGAQSLLLDPDEVTILETITVTATRSPNDSFQVPASVSVVDRQQIEDAQANTLSSVLRHLPNVNYGGGPRSAAQSPAIRGFQGPRIILTVDGARRNFEGGVHTPLLLDPDFVRQIDVVRGPMSASYGSGGLGGVMAFETITGDDFIEEGKNYGGRVRTGYRSANEEFSTNLTAAMRAGDFDVLASGTYRDLGTIRTGMGEDHATYPNDGNLRSGLLKASYRPNDLNDFVLSYQHFNDRHVGPTNPGGNLLFPFSQELSRQQDQFTGNWSFRDENQSWLDGKITLYHTRFKLDGESRSGADDTSFETETSGLSLQNSSRFETVSWASHRLTYGVDYYRDTYANLSNSTPNSVAPDGNMAAFGGFVQDEISVLDDWTVIAALRHDTYEMSSPGQQSARHSRLSPKLTVKYQPWDFLGVYASYGQAFRAPTATEMYSHLDTDRALFNFRSNPDLKPETSTTFEVGAMLSLTDLIANGDRLQAKATYFSEDVKDLIDQQVIGTYIRQPPFSGTGLIFQRRNVAKAERHGAEIELAYSWDALTLGLGYATVRSRNSANGDNLYAPPDKLALGAQYQINENWSVRYLGQFVAAQDYDATELRRRDSYTLHDVGLTYEKNWFRADFSVTNLFDEGYATYQQSQANTFAYEEGRSFNLTLSAKF